MENTALKISNNDQGWSRHINTFSYTNNKQHKVTRNHKVPSLSVHHLIRPRHQPVDLTVLFKAFNCVIASKTSIWQLYLSSAVKLTIRSTYEWTSTSLFLTEWRYRPDAGRTSKSDSKELSASGWYKGSSSTFKHNPHIHHHTPWNDNILVFIFGFIWGQYLCNEYHHKYFYMLIMEAYVV